MERRNFLKSSLLTSSSFVFFPQLIQSCTSGNVNGIHDKIRFLSESLLKKWCQGLYSNQTNDPGNLSVHGGIFSPGDNTYLGRCADAIYPFLWMANHTNDEKYVLAAKKVYAWEQNNCWNQKYGCWVSEPGKPESWNGISVFAAITKLEAIEHYPDLLGEETIHDWKIRLHQVAEFIHNEFHIGYANINYPATAILALFKLGQLFNEEKYTQKATIIADGILSYFTPEGFLFGEGGRKVNKNGQYPIDLGYNVEESLPAIAQYSRLVGNTELYEKVLQSMKVHLEFMLPNGGWDNSWGNRSFKWTMWGSRTSDGCHAGYYTMADEEPVFAEAVYRNLKCLEASTHENILHSGPHEFLEKIAPSTHHTFDHAKSLTTMLNMIPPKINSPVAVLPREKEYGIKKYNDINTILFSKGSWRGTITGYNATYYNKNNAHPTGGALSCLYHTKLGMVSAASMTEYRRWEVFNMIDEKLVDNFMCLTPRLELVIEGKPVYRNISDYNAIINLNETNEALHIKCHSFLVTGKQEHPEAGKTKINIEYKIQRNSMIIAISMNEKPTNGKLSFIFPLVCSSLDKININENLVKLKKHNGSLFIESNYKLKTPLSNDQRVYNFVPGLQAYPIEIDGSKIHEKELLLQIADKNQL